MDRYVAIVAKSNNMYVLLFINEEGTLAIDKKIVNEANLPYVINGVRPINFSVSNGKVCETMGSLDRLQAGQGVQPLIVIQELATSVGTIVGYRLLNPIDFSIRALKKEDIIATQAKASIPILQNGIIRGNKINCYPSSNFPRFIIGTKTRSTVRKSVQGGIQREKAKDTNDFLSIFTSEQRKELSLAKRDGIDIRIIANPKLSAEQMRVLRIAKKKGAYSEYFASPEYSVNVMKFYADRLLTQNMVKECSDLLSHKNYEVDKLSELYLAVCEGIDYSTFIEYDNAENMYVERETLRNKLWSKSNKSSVLDSEYINKGVSIADKLKRG